MKNALRTIPKACTTVVEVFKDFVMRARRSTRHAFLFSLVACVLFCTMAASELPELLTVRNDTSNDFTLRESASSESTRAVSTAPQIVIQRFTAAEVFVLVQPVKVDDGTSAAEPPLFILNSVLRT